MSIKGVIPKTKDEQLAAFTKLDAISETDVSALAAARATPAAYSEEPADIAAVLVALGVMEAEG